MLARYASMTHVRHAPDCEAGKYANDTTVRDQFAAGAWQAIQEMKRYFVLIESFYMSREQNMVSMMPGM